MGIDSMPRVIGDVGWPRFVEVRRRCTGRSYAVHGNKFCECLNNYLKNPGNIMYKDVLIIHFSVLAW